MISPFFAIDYAIDYRLWTMVLHVVLPTCICQTGKDLQDLKSVSTQACTIEKQ